MSLPFETAPHVGTPHRLFRLSAEQRMAPRVQISIGGRFMREDRSEYGGTAIEASVQAIAIQTDTKCLIGERVVGYFYTIGRIEGKVLRLTDDGFILEISTTPLKRDKLANQLTWLANRDLLNLPEDRRHDRVVPRDPRIMVRLVKQEPEAALPGHLIDVSRSGAAVSIRGANFKSGDEILLGTTPAKVVRAFEGGIAVEFHGAVPNAMFDVDLRL
ncbi:MAG: PilZ domain-containing protein [Proteobacteria bacterium]|nr:PilZ domain-containing protein [Pseudomonadota bacterium]